MESTTRRRIRDEAEGAMGLGALILLVAMIILALVVGSTMVLMHEKISQTTTATMEDTRRESVNSVVVVGGWVYDNHDDMLFLMEFGSSGEAVARSDVIYTLSCTDSSGNYFYRSAALGNSAGGSTIYVWQVNQPGPGEPGYTLVNNFAPGERYFFTLDGGTIAAPGGAQCGPIHLAQEGINGDMWLHLPNGMSTHQEIALSNGRVIGSEII